MKKLLSLVRKLGDVHAIVRYGSGYNITLTRRSISLKFDFNEDPEQKRLSVNWGGYGSSTDISKGADHYFDLTYGYERPELTATRKEPLKGLKVVLNGTFSQEEQDKLTKYGAELKTEIDRFVNLVAQGPKANKKITDAAQKADHLLICTKKDLLELLPKPKSHTRITYPKNLKTHKKDLTDTLHSRDLEIIEDYLTELAPKLNTEDIQFLLKCSDFLNGELQGAGPWKPKTKIDGCYVIYGLCSLLHKLQNHKEVKAFCNKITSLSIMGDSHIELKHLGIFTKLQDLELNAKGDMQSSSGWSELPKTLKILTINNTRVETLDWDEKTYSDLEIIRMKSCEVDETSSFCKLPNLAELKIVLTRRYRSEPKTDQRHFGPKLESLHLNGFGLTGLDWEKMPNLKKANISGNFESDLTLITDSKIVELEISTRNIVGLSLSNQSQLKSCNFRAYDYQHTPSKDRHIDISVENCPILEELNLSSMEINNLTINKTPKLKNFRANFYNGRYDLSGTAQMGKMTALEELHLSGQMGLFKLEAAPNLSSARLTGVDPFSKGGGLPPLPKIESLELTASSTHACFPDMPKLTRMTLQMHNIENLKGLCAPNLLDLTLRANNLQDLSGMDLPKLNSLNLTANKLLSLKGLNGDTLSSFTLEASSITTVYELLDFKKLSRLSVGTDTVLTPRITKKDMDAAAVKTYMAKVERHFKKQSKSSKTTKTKITKSKTSKQWVAYFRKLIKSESRNAIAELDSELINLPDDFWDVVLKGCTPAEFVDYKHKYRHTWLPSTRSWSNNSFDMQHWEPVKTILTYDNAVAAAELYLYLLTKAPKDNAHLNECRTSLKVFRLNGTPCFSLDHFENIEIVDANHRYYGSTNAVKLSKLGKLPKLMMANLNSHAIDAQGWSAPASLTTLNARRVTCSDFSFLSSCSLTSLKIEGDISGLKQINGERLTQVEIKTTAPIEGSEFSFLSTSTNIQSLSLNLPECSGKMASLQLSNQLNTLSLTGSIFGNLEFIQNPQFVKTLTLHDVNTENFSIFEPFQKLKTLNLKIKSGDCSTFPTLSELTSLTFETQEPGPLGLKAPQPKLAALSNSTSSLVSIEGIELCQNLTSLRLKLDSGVDLTPLSLLTNLNNINLRFDKATEMDISPLASSVLCKSIYIYGVEKIQSIQFLAAYPQLEQFSCNARSIEDLETLSDIPSLKQVNLFGKNITKMKRLCPSLKIYKA